LERDVNSNKKGKEQMEPTLLADDYLLVNRLS
jgi:hypothetical protein